MRNDKKVTPRGFCIFGEFTDNRGSSIKIQESSAAFTGAHCWIFCSRNEKDDSPHLNVSEARQVIDALQKFVLEAESGQLIEPADLTKKQIMDAIIRMCDDALTNLEN